MTMTPHSNLRGIAYMTLGVSCFPAADAISKYLTGSHDPTQILWLRCLVQLAMVLPLLLPRARRLELRTRRPALHFARALFNLLATLAFITALSHVPLVEAVTILFSGGLFLVALSAVLLGEHVDRARWAAVIVGFAGVLVVMRPGLGVLHWAASLALFAALATALYQVSTRKLAETDSSLTIFFYVTIFGVVALAPVMPFVWTPVTGDGWLYILGAGIAGGLGHWFMIKSLAHAPGSVVAPFNYAQIVAATGLGWAWFGDIPDLWTFVGLAIVIGSGLAIAARERRAVAEAKRP